MVQLAIYPIVIGAYNRNDEDRHNVFSKSNQLVILILLPVTAGFLGIYKGLFHFLLPEDVYPRVIPIVHFLIIANLFVQLKSLIFDYAFHISKKKWQAILSSILRRFYFSCFKYYVD
ncbi:hypothetical protein [Photobacterium leiognathi]|uniref:hypothetical protein n=1 Tax=Photobacterium leiognathi TaxID=553611 RepID=UPI0027342625|nr:hypothetical protein [Photobacterium leiognathi]